MQLKSVKPPTPALFQMLISLWLLFPRSQGTCVCVCVFFFLSLFFNPAPLRFYLDVIPFIAFALCLGQVVAYLQPSVISPTISTPGFSFISFSLSLALSLSLCMCCFGSKQTKVYHSEAYQAASAGRYPQLQH